MKDLLQVGLMFTLFVWMPKFVEVDGEYAKREWMSDYCLTPSQAFVNHIMVRLSYIYDDDDDDDVLFVLEQHAELYYAVR